MRTWGRSAALLLTLLGAWGCAPAADPVADTAPAAPNILLILLDDLGVNDLGSYGNPAARTPHIDALAARGVRFTRHYVDSTCSATRAGILTGLEPARLSFRSSHQGISPETVTIAELLRQAGYTTHHIGKWHLGFTTALALPGAQGFDSYFGFLDQVLLRGPHRPGSWNYRRPTHRDPWLQYQDQVPRPHRGQLDEILTREAEKFLAGRAASAAPWMLNLWLYAPHSPLEPAPEFAAARESSPRGRYLALVDQADAAVGRVMAALAEHGLADNTLVLLASDNGGTGKQYDSNAPFAGGKMTFLEGGVRTPLIAVWPGRLPAATVFDETVTLLDYFPTMAAAAGAPLPAGRAGRNLLDLVRAPSALAAPLFWEAENPSHRSWAVLSADGRWRLSQFYVGNPVLNDLQADPGGATDVSAAYPEVVAALQREHLQWQRRVRELQLDYRPLAATGRARLEGDSLQRSPGYGGHTFAIGFSLPADPDRQHRGIIASQAGQWSLRLDGQVLSLVINGHAVEAAVGELTNGDCHSLVVSSDFRFSRLQPATDKAVLQLYLDSERHIHRQIPRPPLPPDDFLTPTYIGQAQDGSGGWPGVLSRPVLFNRSIGIHPAALEQLPAELETLAARVCGSAGLQ